MGLELLALACAYAIQSAWERGWAHTRQGVSAAGQRAREAAASRMQGSRGGRVAMAAGHGAAVGARGLWRAGAGLARALRAGWDTGWARGVEKGRERQERRRQRKEAKRRDALHAQGICPQCEHRYRDGRVDGCGCSHEKCPCSVRPAQRGEDDEPEPSGGSPATDPAEPEPVRPAPSSSVITSEDGQVRWLSDRAGGGAMWYVGTAEDRDILTRIQKTGAATLDGPAVEAAGRYAAERAQPPQQWDEEVILRRKRPAPETEPVEEPAPRRQIEAEVVGSRPIVDVDQVLAGSGHHASQPHPIQPHQPRGLHWMVNTWSPDAILAAPRPYTDELPLEYAARISGEGWDAKLLPEPDPSGALVVDARIREDGPLHRYKGETNDAYLDRVRAAGFRLEPHRDGLGYQVAGYTPPPPGGGSTTATATSGGDDMPVQGDGSTIGRTRQALRGFASDAQQFVLTSDQAVHDTATVRGEAGSLVAAAERLGAHMAAAEVDAESVGEVHRIQEEAAGCGAAADRLAAAVAEVQTFADTLSSESRASLAKLDSGHRALEHARREAPNNGAKKSWYQPA